MTGRAAPEPRGDVTDRLTCHYELRCRPGESAEHKARGIALEQTVELPDAVLSDAIRESIVGRVERLEQHSTRRWHAVISYPAGIVAGEWPALLNLLYGNISLKPGILLTDIDWPAALLEQFGGPAFGVAGLRELLGAPARGLCATALTIKMCMLGKRGFVEIAEQCVAKSRYLAEAVGGLDGYELASTAPA